MFWKCCISNTEVASCSSLCQKLCYFKNTETINIFYTARVEHKMLYTTNKTVLFFRWHKSLYRYRVNLPYRTACSFLLFNLTQFIRSVLERSIQNFLMFSQSQCCLYQEQLHVSVSTDRQHNAQKQYENTIHIDLTYIAFSVWDQNSVQCLVIQQLAVTELFCRA